MNRTTVALLELLCLHMPYGTAARLKRCYDALHPNGQGIQPATVRRVLTDLARAGLVCLQKLAFPVVEPVVPLHIHRPGSLITDDLCDGLARRARERWSAAPVKVLTVAFALQRAMRIIGDGGQHMRFNVAACGHDLLVGWIYVRLCEIAPDLARLHVLEPNEKAYGVKQPDAGIVRPDWRIETLAEACGRYDSDRFRLLMQHADTKVTEMNGVRTTGVPLELW